MSDIISLPGRNEMLRQLCAVNNNEWHRIFLYPKILKASGEQKGPHGIVGLIIDAIDVCTVGMPLLMVKSIRKQVPAFIDAIVIAHNVREQAKILFEREHGDRFNFL